MRARCILDGEPVHSCIYPGASDRRPRGDHGRRGSAAGDDLHPMQEAFVEHFGFQCGFCTAGMIVTASTLDEDSLDDLPRLMKGNLCRCTGYRSMTESIAAGVAESARRGRAENLGSTGLDDRPARCTTTSTRPRRATTAPAEPTAVARSTARRAAGRAGARAVHVRRARAPAALILRVLGSPHAARADHGRSTPRQPRRSTASSGPHGRRRAPDPLSRPPGTSTAADDPDDTRMLDTSSASVGQRVAAVVADDRCHRRSRPAGFSRSTTRCCRRCSTRRRPARPAPR